MNERERKTKVVLNKIEPINPSPFTIKKYDPDCFNELSDISNKINSLPEEHTKVLYNPKRKKIKIGLGKFGNLIATAFGFANSKNRTENSIIELLMIK